MPHSTLQPRHAPFLQLVDSSLVLSQIQLGAHKDDRRRRGVMGDLGIPLPRSDDESDCHSTSLLISTHLGPDVLKTGRADEGEADQEDVGLGVGQWAESVVIFLTGGIPQPEGDGLAIHHYIGGVVVEH